MKKYNGTINLYTIDDGYNGGVIKILDNPTEEEFIRWKNFFAGNYKEDYAVEFRPANPKPGLRGFEEGAEELILNIFGEKPIDRKTKISFAKEQEAILSLTEQEFLDFEAWASKLELPFVGFYAIKTGWFTDEQLWEGASHGLQVKNPFRDQWVTVWEPCM